jgi:hypothetical protein
MQNRYNPCVYTENDNKLTQKKGYIEDVQLNEPNSRIDELSPELRISVPTINNSHLNQKSSILTNKNSIQPTTLRD